MRKLLTGALALLMLAVFTGCAQGAAAESAGVTPDDAVAPNGGGAAVESSEDGAGKLSIILNSFSTKEFAAKEVSAEDIELILQSGAKAPSAMNAQPWRFTVVSDPALTAKFMREPVAGPVFIVVSGLSEAPNGIDPVLDCALATQNMYIAAQALGLGARIYTGPVADVNAKERENLKLPEGYDAVALLCVGYMKNEADAISSASTRNPLDDMVNYTDS